MNDFSETEREGAATGAVRGPASEQELREAEEELRAAEHLTPLADPLAVPLESPLPEGDTDAAAQYRRAVECVREGAPRETVAEGTALLQKLAAGGGEGAGDAATAVAAAAQNMLGVLEQRAVGAGAADAAPERALRWYERAAARGLAAAEYNAALCTATGTGVFPDADAAYARFAALAARADAPAEVALQLGSACERGCGTARDAAAAAQHYRRGAERGCAACMARLGALCLHGARGVPRARTEAARWLRRAVALGDAAAACSLAEALFLERDADSNRDDGEDDNQNTEPDNQEDGAGDAERKDARDGAAVEKEALGLLHAAAARGHAPAYTRLGARWAAAGDAALAVRYYRAGAALGDADACVALGTHYARGAGVAASAETAATWFRRAADAGCGRGEYELARAYLRGRGVAQDTRRAVWLVTSAAERGVPEAQCLLGRLYLRGTDSSSSARGGGLEKDEAEGMRWLRRAAEEGYAKALVAIGACYGDANAAEAASWYRRAAAAGCAKGQHALGLCYRDGRGVPRDADEAARWLRRAAEQGYAPAQCALGACYRDGRAFPRDACRALHWTLRAAAQGNGDALCQLGTDLLHGTADSGLCRDTAEACACLRRAAERGHAGAQYQLGMCYRDGIGVPRSAADARHWLQLAANSAHQPAVDALKYLSAF